MGFVFISFLYACLWCVSVFLLGPVQMLAKMEFWSGIMVIHLTQFSSGQIGI